MTCKHDWQTLNGRNGWARCSKCNDETPWQGLVLMMSDTYEERLEKVERLGAQMAATIFNVRQPGFHINDHDRDVMGELVKKWDTRDKVIK